MAIAPLNQNLQDFITQQWVILFGKKIAAAQYQWLLGPFGKTNGIGEKFITQLAENENLIRATNTRSKGIIQAIGQLNLPEHELKRLSKAVIDFYENTSAYSFDLKVQWHPFFKVFGVLLRILFSKRIEQLNVPMDNGAHAEALKSEIIQLVTKNTKEVKRTIWLRSFVNSGQVVYSGVYETCTIPAGQTCIKAIFPLPNGSATVILKPSVGDNGELILTSSGKKIGDSGFYFLLKDAKDNLWTKFIRSFKDELVVSATAKGITAKQQLTLWHIKVLSFQYSIHKVQTENLFSK